MVGGDCFYKLSELAYLRSGDKGDTANIGELICLTVTMAALHLFPNHSDSFIRVIIGCSVEIVVF